MCLHVDDFILCFKNHWVTILDQVAPVKSNVSAQKKVCPWMNENILSLKRLCQNPQNLRRTGFILGIFCGHSMRRLKMPDLIISVNW